VAADAIVTKVAAVTIRAAKAPRVAARSKLAAR
jgi:hypothetical protein